MFEEYKVWGLHAMFGPMFTIEEDVFPIDLLFWNSREDLEKMGFRPLFFLK